MATKTLSIKFETKGVKETASSLKIIKEQLNETLKQNDKIKLFKNNRVVQGSSSSSFSEDETAPSNGAARYVRQETTISSKTIDKFATKFAEKFKKIELSISRNDENQGGNKHKNTPSPPPHHPKGFGNFGAFVKDAFMAATFPIRTIMSGYYSGIGGHFGSQTGKGLAKTFDEDLDFSFNRRGQTIGKGITNLFLEGSENLKQEVDLFQQEFKDLFKSFNGKKLLDFVKQFNRTITSLPTDFLRGYKKGSIKVEALHKLKTKLQEVDYNEATDLSGIDTAFFSMGGLAGKKGKAGYLTAEVLSEFVDQKGIVFGADTTYTDVKTGATESLSGWVVDTVTKIIGLNAKGFNPDAINLVAKIVPLLEKNKELKVRITGDSGGGFPTEEAQELLDLLGYGDRVSSLVIATPDGRSGLNNPRTEKKIGDGDSIIKNVEKIGAFLGISNERKGGELKGVKGHFTGDYLMSEDYLRAILKDRFDENKAKKKAQKFKGNLIELEALYIKYLSGLIQTSEELSDYLDPAGATRRGKIKKNAFRSIVAQKLKDDFEAIKVKEKTENAIVLVGGEGKSTKGLAEEINSNSLDKKTEYIGLTNAPTDREKNNKQGFNDEASKIAAQVLDLMAKKPNLNIKIVSNASLGGQEIQQDVIDLLKAYGADLSRVSFPDKISSAITKPRSISKGFQQKYSQYLNKLIKNATTTAEATVAVVVQDFKALSKDGQQNYLESIRSVFNAKAKLFRTAIKNGQLDIAKDQGEKLLKLSALLKSLYTQLDQDEDIEGEVKSKLLGIKKYITSVQNEVLVGSKGKGRVAVGLPSILEEQGENVTDGFIESILAEINSVKEVGEEIGDAVAEGTTESLDSHSPSRRFIKIARDVIAGFRQGLGLENVSGIGEELGDDIVSGVTAPLNELKNKFPILGKIKKALLPIVGIFLGGMGLKGVIEALARFNQELFQAAMQAETLNRAIIVVSRNSNEGAKNLEFISSKAQQLGIDINTAKAAYSSFIGAAKDTPLEGLQIEQVFDAFAETATLRGLSQESSDRLFTALSQIIAKRKFTAEEVRSQIGDIAGMGDFINLVAQAQGVSVPQVEDMMSKGQIGLDALPKIAAVLKAQNSMAKGTETAQTLQTKYNNSLTIFKETLGAIFAPFSKFVLKIKTIAIDGLIDKLEILTTILNQLIGTVLIVLLRKVNIIPPIINAIKFAVEGLVAAVAKIWAARIVILQFLGAWLLVAVAFKTITNLFNIAKNQFPEAKKDIDSLTKGINAFNDALREASNSQKEFNDNLPKSNKDLQFNEGLLGQSWLNLDTLARKPINWVLDRFGVKEPAATPVTRPGLLDNQEQFDPHSRASNQGWIDAVRTLMSKRLVTMAEKRQNDFIVNAGDYQFKSNQVMMDTYKASQSAEKITQYDAQIAEIQSARLSLLPSQVDELKASLEAERKIQEERDKELKILTQQQQNLQLVIDAGKRRLEELEQLRLEGGITQGNYDTQKAGIETTIADAESNLKDVNDIIGRLPKQLSEFNRQLKNASLRVSGFMENRDRANSQERTNIIQQGLIQGKGDTVIQLELESQSRGDIEARISNLQSEIAKQEKLLGSAALDTAMQRLEEAAQSKGGLTTDVINEMLEQERDGSEKEALSGAVAVRGWQTQLYQYQEQLAQSMQQSRSSMIDFNRTIQDYFFNLIQQIKEAQLEAKTLLSQILGSKIKNKLKAALIPGSDSFVNGLIEGIQGLLDQAQTLIEQTLGLEGNKIQLESSNYSLDKEMQDFIKSVSGATDALSRFRESLGMVGGGGDSEGSSSGVSPDAREPRSNNQPIGNNSSVVDSLRRAIIGKESAGKFNAVNPDSGALGYGQVMPANVPSWTKAALGKSLSVDEFLNNPDAQIKTINHKLNQYLAKELKATGNNLDVAVRRVASTWYSGQPNLYNNTRPQYYNGASYPSINDYTADILTRFKNDAGVNVEDAMPGETPGISAVRSVNNQGLSDRSNNAQAVTDALVLTNRLKADKNLNAYLQEQKNAQDKIGFDLQLQQQLQQQERQFIANQRESERTLFGISDRLFEFGNQGKLQTANTELEQGIRSLVGQFRDYKLELAGIKQTYQDSVQMLTNATQRFPEAISIAKEQVEMLRSAGQFEAASAAEAQVKILEESLRQANQALPYYQQQLSGIEAQEKRLPDLEKKAIAFYRRQGEIKLDAERISKNSAIAQLKVNIASERGTNELRRQNDLLAEQWRLSSEINRIRLEEGDTPLADELIKLQEEQSKINVENINRGAYDRDLSYEQKLLDLDAGVKNTRGGLLSGFGDLLGGNKLQREAAISQENFRFYKELIDLRREYSAEPEKLDILINKATELNQVNLEQIKQQFKGLKDTLIDLGRTNLGTFFESAMEGIFNRGEKQLELKEQELQYREELIDAENKYQDNSSGLDFARDRIKKLNEEKLDKIRNELNLFNTVVNAARTAVVNLLKEIARMAAQKLAAKIIGTIFSSFSSGVSSGGAATTSLNFDAGNGTFSASEGITVPNYDKGGIIEKSRTLFNSEAFNNAKTAMDNTKGGFFKKAVSFFSTLKNSKKRVVPTSYSNYLRSTSPAIDDAFSREGSKGVLGVFTPGEEILSVKTGEAGRYQALKQKLGLDPLKKIFAGNFATGGTVDIEKNLLARLPSISTPVSLTGIGNQKSNIPTSVQNITNFSATVVTPNADSFRASSYQTQQDIAEALLRARR